MADVTLLSSVRLQPLSQTMLGKGAATNKHAYFVAHRADARAAYDDVLPTFGGDEPNPPLLRELRSMFDWMAQQQGAERMASRAFKHRLPEIHRKFPQLATSFRRMDANGDGWLTWDEFASFCLKDQRLQEQCRRAMCITVYGLDLDGTRCYKDDIDPAHMCEMGIPPALLPWEAAHVVEWRVEGLTLGYRGAPVKHGNLTMHPGMHMASPPFRAAGVCGFLRFWPSGYYTETQRQKKVKLIPGSEDFDNLEAGGPPPCVPAADSWCCLGACLPAGTHLAVRFFVGDMKSPPRECWWKSGTHVVQLWTPPAREPPANHGASEPFVVGIEILRNLGLQHGRPHPERVDFRSRRHRRPPIREPGGTLGRTASAPGLATSLPSLGPAAF